MKRILKTTDRFHTLIKIMDKYPEAFEGLTAITDARDTFINSNERISEIITRLNKPYTEYYGVKRDHKDKLRLALRLAIGTGITVAIRQNNTPVLQVLRRYKLMLNRTTMHDLPEMANRVYDELKLNETEAIQSGLKAEKLAELQELTGNFREIIETTDYEINARKASRNELQSLVSECNRILRDQLDAFVMHCRDEYPGFYNAYMTRRKPAAGRKKAAATASGLSEISGTVTDSLTGQPVAQATVNLLNQELVFATDNDGYYLADELEAGKYVVSCYAPGYAVPQQFSGDLQAGESLVVDFTLVPVNAQNN